MSNVTSNNFYTLVLRQSGEYWVALCLENGIVGQGETQEMAISQLQIAIDSMADIYRAEPAVVKSISIQELHEFLEIADLENNNITTNNQREIYELHKVYA
jgi:predicted RNase H-like HicB family nuclease